MNINNNKLFNSFTRLLILSAGIGSITDQYDTFVIGGASASIISSLKISIPEFGLLGAMTFIGGLFGALSFGFLSDKIGRKKTFTITLVLFIIFEILAALAPNYPSLLFFRFVVGYAIGADYVPSITMLSEFAENIRRGSFFGLYFAIGLSGGLVAYIVAFFLIPLGPLQWRILFLTGAIPPAIGLVVRTRLPESPRWYATKGDIKSAKKVLNNIGLDENYAYQYEKYHAVKQLKLIKPYIIAITIPLFLVVMLLNIAPSGFAELTPIILTGLGISKAYSLLFTALTFVLPTVIGCLVAFKIIDKLGRIKMLLLGTFGMGLSLIGMYLLIKNVIFLLIVFSAGSFLIAFFLPIIYSIATELYPTKIRGIGQGIAITGIRTGGIIGLFGGSIILSTYKLGGLLIVYSLISFIAFLIILLWLGKKAETNNTNLEDIDKKFINTE